MRLAFRGEHLRDLFRDGRHSLREEALLERVEVLKGPRLRPFRHVVAEEPPVEEALVALVAQVRRDDGIEEFPVLEVEE